MEIKGIIPAGGYGTRLKPLTEKVPKEMLTVGPYRIIEWAIYTHLKSGISSLAIIINPQKIILRDFIKTHFPFVKIFYQKKPKGVLDALLYAKEFISDCPFTFFMPDTLLISEVPFWNQILPCFLKYKRHTVGIIYLSQKDVRYFGNTGLVKINIIKGTFVQILSISEKIKNESIRIGPKGTFRIFGGGIYLPDYLDYISHIKPDSYGELDDTALLQQLASERKLFGVILKGIAFDLGHLDGYKKANHYLKTRFYFKKQEIKQLSSKGP